MCVSFIYSFIHSFIRFISSRQRQEHDRHPSLSFFFLSLSFLYILFDSLCANVKEEWGKKSSFSRFFYIHYNDKNETIFPVIHSFEIKKKKKRKTTGLNHKSSFLLDISAFFSHHHDHHHPKCECILYTFEVACERFHYR